MKKHLVAVLCFVLAASMVSFAQNMKKDDMKKEAPAKASLYQRLGGYDALAAEFLQPAT